MNPRPRPDTNGVPDKRPLHEAIVQELGQGVIGGTYAPGQTLPTPAELQSRFGAARSTIREALRVLAAKGLVNSRQRVGTTVLPRAQWHLFDPDVLRWGLVADPDRVLAEFIQLRGLMEPEIAALAAQNRTNGDLAVLRTALDRLAACTCVQERVDSDVAFHQGLAAATHNDMAAYLGRLMSHPLREAIMSSAFHPDHEALTIPRHRAILNAIEIGDAAGARAASLVQLRESADVLRARVLPPTVA